MFIIAVLRVWEAVFGPFGAFVSFRNSKGVAGQIVAAFTQKNARKICAEKRCRNWLVAEDERERGNRGVAKSEKEIDNNGLARSGNGVISRQNA